MCLNFLGIPGGTNIKPLSITIHEEISYVVGNRQNAYQIEDLIKGARGPVRIACVIVTGVLYSGIYILVIGHNRHGRYAGCQFPTERILRTGNITKWVAEQARGCIYNLPRVQGPP